MSIGPCLVSCCIAVAVVLGLATPTGAETPYPAVLQEAGFSEDAYACLLTWTEGGADGGWLWGYRLAPRDGTPPRVVYLDADGQAVDAATLRRAGIGEKPWGLAVARDTERAAVHKTRRSAPVPPATHAKHPVPVFHVSAPDVAALVEEDRLRKDGGIRTGVVQSLTVPVEAGAGAWQSPAEGGPVLRLGLWSPGATGLRLRITAATLPVRGRLWVHAPGQPQAAELLDLSRGGAWSATVFGEEAEIAYQPFDPADEAAPGWHIDQVVYQYADFDGLMKQAGGCNIDASCVPEWAEAARAVGGLGTIGRDGALWCSGSLLADADPGTEVPYFLTAEHCVGTQGRADTVEVYWRYENSACQTPPAPPRLVDVPRNTGGAELLAASPMETGTDIALLRLRQPVPEGLAFLGFSSAAHPPGGRALCIHHPRGDFKRISFGDLTEAGSPSNLNRPRQPLARFHEVLWETGTTEGGSSGSPLIDPPTGRVIGQLWGGRAACIRPEEPDYYGRFDVSYPLVARWLGEAPPHPYDVNGDGAFNSADLQRVVNAALGRAPLAAADLDGSGRADAVDVQLIVGALLAGGR